ncbi:arsenosugar biosynthesis radical SAM (seleno)protein ArsS [Prochlorococcus sp. MIT 1300]|uniref:arsenosugar biosynthesis radical SAM (seleno)protein ArsS n=1 Tax=Prochlorococcus sp. MIT 1300 TaxID=3096218 RepID=UPI002A75F668|nr:arsenosugar biosynthesis radical SAM (seleno)protein ArsS [Prochlorococcus sp. MIT 1300]
MFPKFVGPARVAPEVLQVNLGYRCNQRCTHCHVNASPEREEMMSGELIPKLLDVLDLYRIKVLDITGGAPELHPHFKSLAEQARSKEVEVIDRCNLTILFENEQKELANFLANNKITIVASLPCYSQENVDKQRGEGVFEKSIRALNILNGLGYGKRDTGLTLNLVYNPVGMSLPPEQKELEEQYRNQLRNSYRIEFSNLITITNMPIQRFSNELKRNGNYNEYMNLLIRKYNPNNLEHLMCRNIISVDWQGKLYDCDFNQQLGIGVKTGPRNIDELLHHKTDFEGNQIAFGSHCYGCTAGSGSSCSGSLL